MDLQDHDSDLHEKRVSTFDKFEAHWKSIIDKYSAYDYEEESEENGTEDEYIDNGASIPAENNISYRSLRSKQGKNGVPDILDLRTGHLVRDNGHIKSLNDARTSKEDLWVFDDDENEPNEQSDDGIYPSTPTKQNSTIDTNIYSPSKKHNPIVTDSDDSLRDFSVSPKKQRLTRSVLRQRDNLRITPTRHSSPISITDSKAKSRPVAKEEDPLKFNTNEYVIMPDGSINTYSNATVSVNYDVQRLLTGKGITAAVSGNNVNPSKTRRFLKALEKARDTYYYSDDERSFRLKKLLLTSRKKKSSPVYEEIKDHETECPPKTDSVFQRERQPIETGNETVESDAEIERVQVEDEDISDSERWVASTNEVSEVISVHSDTQSASHSESLQSNVDKSIEETEVIVDSFEKGVQKCTPHMMTICLDDSVQEDAGYASLNESDKLEVVKTMDKGFENNLDVPIIDYIDDSPSKNGGSVVQLASPTAEKSLKVSNSSESLSSFEQMSKGRLWKDDTIVPASKDLGLVFVTKKNTAKKKKSFTKSEIETEMEGSFISKGEKSYLKSMSLKKEPVVVKDDLNRKKVYSKKFMKPMKTIKSEPLLDKLSFSYEKKSHSWDNRDMDSD